MLWHCAPGQGTLPTRRLSRPRSNGYPVGQGRRVCFYSLAGGLHTLARQQAKVSKSAHTLTVVATVTLTFVLTLPLTGTLDKWSRYCGRWGSCPRSRSSLPEVRPQAGGRDFVVDRSILPFTLGFRAVAAICKSYTPSASPSLIKYHPCFEPYPWCLPRCHLPRKARLIVILPLFY